jgi:GT2 family glycosyltransferase
VALGFVKGEIAAFLDDDAFVRVGWAAAMIGSYADSSVAGVAGRALNGIRGEEDLGLNEIGKLKPNGFLTGNFAANPGNIVEVDHAIGCNMSLRREVVQRLGGFRDDYRAGPFGICEETEIFVRAKRLGYRFIFNPDAIVDHIGAPQPGRRRFSPTYSYYHSRNLMTMLVRNFGWRIITFRHAGASSAYSIKDFLRKMAGAAAHLICGVAGVVVGMIAGTWLLVIRGSDPIRSDAVGEEIRTALAAQEAASTLKSTALSPMVTASGVKISRDVALESRPNC